MRHPGLLVRSACIQMPKPVRASDKGLEHHQISSMVMSIVCSDREKVTRPLFGWLNGPGPGLSSWPGSCKSYSNLGFRLPSVTCTVIRQKFAEPEMIVQYKVRVMTAKRTQPLHSDYSTHTTLSREFT